MMGRDHLLFIVLVVALLVVHRLIFGSLSDDRATQLWIFAAMAVIVRAIREGKSA